MAASADSDALALEPLLAEQIGNSNGGSPDSAGGSA
jgi:hypothetical protein